MFTRVGRVGEGGHMGGAGKKRVEDRKEKVIA